MTFDGDKMASRPLLTQEANQEAKEFLDNPQSVFTLDGTNYRALMNRDTISGYYSFTIDDNKAPRIPDELGKQIAESKDFKLLMSHTLDTVDKKAKYKISSPFKYQYRWGDQSGNIETTLGRAFFNFYVMQTVEAQYWNNPLTGKEQKALLEREGTKAYTNPDPEYFKKFNVFLTKWEELAFVAADVYGASMDMKTFAPGKEFNSYRDKLVAENQEKIEQGDLIAYEEMEKKLIVKLKETQTTSTELYDSGSKLSYNDDLRMGLVSVGPMPIGVGAGKYAISSSSLMKGTTIKERHLYSQSNIVAGYFRAMGPAVGGEIGKEVYAAFHDVLLDYEGTDCKTTKTVSLFIDKYMMTQLEYMHHYDKRGKLEQLTPEVIKKYEGQNLNVRTPITCSGNDICSICAGQKPYMIARTKDKIRIGAQMSKIGDEITQASLSKFHSSKVQYTYVDFNKYIVPASGENDFKEMSKKTSNVAESVVQNIIYIDRMMNLMEASDSEVNDVLNDIDELCDEILSDNPEMFDLGPEGTVEDFDNDSVSVFQLDKHIEVFEDKKFDMLNDMLDNCRLPSITPNGLFGGMCNNVNNALNVLRQADISTFIEELISHEDLSKPFLYEITSHDNTQYSRLVVPLIAFDYRQVVMNAEDEDIKDPTKFTFACMQAIQDIKEVLKLDAEWLFEVETEDMVFAVYLQLDKIIRYNKETLDIHEAVVLDQATKNKMYSKIKNTNIKMRSKLDSAIKQLTAKASESKVRVKKDLFEAIQRKQQQLEQDMRVAKDEQRKQYVRMLQDFEVKYMSKNKFKIQKIKNKLNFILSKKYTNIDNVLNQNISKLKKKIYSKIKTSDDKIRAKYQER